MKDHDIYKSGSSVLKRDESAPRPHADGCVGCRRAEICIKCGKRATLGVDRCLSGACAKCCKTIHVHVAGDPMQIAADKS